MGRKKNEIKQVDNKEILQKTTTDIIDSVVKENDVDKLKDLTALFNMNLAKKNMIRILQLNHLLDNVSDQVRERLEKRSDEITNKELIDYMNIIQGSIEKSSKTLDIFKDPPAIQLNQQNNEVNINVGSNLDRESKTRVLDIIRNLLNSANTPETVEAEVVNEEDIEETEDENNIEEGD